MGGVISNSSHHPFLKEIFNIMIRVVNVCEKDVTAAPCLVVVVPAATKTDVTPAAFTSKAEYAGRYIQNVGTNPTFYAFGQDCDSNTNYHGVLAAGQQLDCSNHCMRVCCYSVAGTTIATTILIRGDLTNQQNIISGNFTNV